MNVQTPTPHRGISQKQLDAILEAVRNALNARDAAIRAELAGMVTEEVRKAVQHGDGAALMRGSYGAVMNANLGAIAQTLDALEHKRSVVRSGRPSPFMAKVLGLTNED